MSLTLGGRSMARLGKFMRPFSRPGALCRLLFGGYIAPLPPARRFTDPDRVDRPFADHYRDHIRPLIEKFEEKRRAALVDFRKRLFIGLPAAVLVAGGSLFWLMQVPNEYPIVLLAVGLALIGYWCTAPARRYRESVKETVYPAIFSYFGEDYRYLRESPLSVRSLRESDLIPSYDDEHREDYIEGSYRDVGLRLFEAHLTEERGSGKHRRTVTVFKGIFILFEAHKRFSGKTVVRRDRGSLFNWFEDKFSALDRVRLESPEFENLFEVYGSDQVEARYLLTPSFMERLMTLSRLLGSDSIQCSFYDARLLLMVPSSKDRFETSSIYEPATFEADIETILEEMEQIFEIVETLKLHERTGL